jgi:hypothetical protein
MSDAIEETWEGDDALALLAHLLEKIGTPTERRKIRRIIFSMSGKEIKLLVRVGEEVLAVDNPDEPLEPPDPDDRDYVLPPKPDNLR